MSLTVLLKVFLSQLYILDNPSLLAEILIRRIGIDFHCSLYFAFCCKSV